MNKALGLLLFLFILNCGCSQTFEAERGGFYFFSPIKQGFIGMSTTSLNIGVGEYISSGNTVTIYNLDGSVKENSNVDCRTGKTTGFANEDNDYSYLLSHFINAKSSLQKLVLYQIDQDGDLDKVSINFKSEFSEVLGRGSYFLDLKYGLATQNSFIFIFSKYEDELETFYLVSVSNETDNVDIEKIDFELKDEDLKDATRTNLKFVPNGDKAISIIQMVKTENEYFSEVKDYSIDGLKIIRARSIKLDFLGSEIFPCMSSQTHSTKTFESNFSTLIQRNFLIYNNYLLYEYVNENLIISGLYYSNKNGEFLDLKAAGLFNVTVSPEQYSAKIISKRITFDYASLESKTPAYMCLYGNSTAYYSFLFKDEKKLYCSNSGSSLENVNLKNADPMQGLIYSLDHQKSIEKKYLKSKRSGIYRSSKLFFCLYGLKANSTGLYTKLTYHKFTK